ncbi:toxic anion resistance protein (TelA) [mine drainage metagenome]|uniref:Toxic anion resistance protein (TelA) n=1 Tax=mine drainage metagenome TaxID=410659 RepID=A0A1J5PVB7_9ZZZZ
MERGVFDIESVQKANDTLIATINESLQFADDGRTKRAAAEQTLTKMESDLRDTLASARARTATPAVSTTGA